MVMLIVKALIVIALIGMIAFPKMFFAWLEQVLFEEPNPEVTVPFVDRQHVVQQDSVGLEADERRLANIDRMILQATTSESLRIWTIKKSEYLRDLKWKRLVEYAGAVQTG